MYDATPHCIYWQDGLREIVCIFPAVFPSTRRARTVLCDPHQSHSTQHFGGSRDRRLLQSGNTGIVSLVWIDALVKQLQPLQSYVITDARFKNEVDALKSHGFRIVYLNVDQETRKHRLRQLYPENATVHIDNMNDVSEVQLCPADGHEVWSNVDREGLLQRIRALV